MLTLSKSSSGQIANVPNKNISVFEVIKVIFKKSILLIKSCVIGTLVGILPGTGGAVASFVSYAEAKRSSKQRHLFGKGCAEGLIAPESANKAAVGGSFVPLLALGVPGSTTSAIIFGALMIHGLNPGPKLFVEHAQTVYVFMYGMILVTIIMGIVGILGVPLFAKILNIKVLYLVPVILIFSILGAYSIRNFMFDVVLAIVFGFIGIMFKKIDRKSVV